MIKITFIILITVTQITAQIDGDTLFTESELLYHNNFSALYYDKSDARIHETTDLTYSSSINFRQARSIFPSGLNFELKTNSVRNLKSFDIPQYFDSQSISNNTISNYNLQLRKLFSEEQRRTFQLINF